MTSGGSANLSQRASSTKVGITGGHSCCCRCFCFGPSVNSHGGEREGRLPCPATLARSQIKIAVCWEGDQTSISNFTSDPSGSFPKAR